MGKGKGHGTVYISFYHHLWNFVRHQNHWTPIYNLIHWTLLPDIKASWNHVKLGYTIRCITLNTLRPPKLPVLLWRSCTLVPCVVAPDACGVGRSTGEPPGPDTARSQSPSIIHNTWKKTNLWMCAGRTLEKQTGPIHLHGSQLARQVISISISGSGPEPSPPV